MCNQMKKKNCLGGTCLTRAERNSIFGGVDELLAALMKTGENNIFEEELKTNGIYLVISS